MSEIISHPYLELLLDYWRAKRRGRAMPGRADIDPTEIPGRVWQHLMLLEVERAGARELRFRYRLAGSHFEDTYGGKVSGEYVEDALDMLGDYKAYVLGIFRAVVEQRIPLYTENEFILPGQSVPVLTKRLALPLSEDGETVTMTLSGHVFERPLGDQLTFRGGISNFRELARWAYRNGRWAAATAEPAP